MRKLFIILMMLLVPSIGLCNSEVSIGGKTGRAVIWQDEGISLRPRPYVNFTGAGVTCSDDSGKTKCNITGGGSGGAGDTFKTWSVPNGTNLVADSTTDTVTFTETGGIIITGTEGTDTINFSVAADIERVGGCVSGECLVTGGNITVDTVNTYTFNQSVASGAAPTFTSDNLSDGGSNAIVTTTQETNFTTAYTHSQDNTQAHTDYLLNNANDSTTGVITSTGFTIGSAAILEAELEVIDGATLTTTELNYVDGVTSAIQTQIDGKEAADTDITKKNETEVITGDWDFGGGGLEIENGTTPPACTTGQIYLDTNATSGQQLMGCEAGTFVLQGDGGGATINTADIADVNVTQTEFAELETMDTNSISFGNWTGVSNLSGTNTGDEVVASKTASGTVELATTAEIDTGTDSTRAIPIDQFVASEKNVRWLVFNLVEAGTSVATATNIYGDFESPIAGTILQSDTAPFYLYATSSTAGVTGTMVVDISIGGTSIMTTNKLDFDTAEKTTTTASTFPDLTTTALAVGDIITIDVDSIQTTAAKGLTVYIAIRE